MFYPLTSFGEDTMAGPARGISFKRMTLACDKTAVGPLLGCRDLEAKRTKLSSIYNTRIKEDSTLFSENYLTLRNEVRQIIARRDSMDSELQDQGCINEDNTYNSKGNCVELSAKRSEFVRSTNPIVEKFNALAKNDDLALHTLTIDAKRRISQADEEIQSCRTKHLSLLDSCQKQAEESIISFEIAQGYDEPERGLPERSFEFLFGDDKGKSVADASLLIRDTPSVAESEIQSSLMIFFPRLQLPSLQVQEDQTLLVSLGNGETVKFSMVDHIPTDGVLLQYYPVVQGLLRPPGVQYIGQNYVLRADWVGSHFNQKRITFEGHDKKCDLTKYGRTILNSNRDFKFSTDKEWNSFVRAKCGFSISE